MRQGKIILILLTTLLTSCYKEYEVRVSTTEKVLVVDGLVTDQADAYNVVLSYASPFNSNESPTPVNSANVYVTDNLGNSYEFREIAPGDYKSDPLEFTGIPGRSYKLNIITVEGDQYQSDLQRLFPGSSPGSIYPEFDTREDLDKLTGKKNITSGVVVLTDIDNLSDSLPRYRFTSDLVRQYSYAIFPKLNSTTTLTFNFYCWKTTSANSDINLTSEEYSLNSAPVKKHPVCFVDDYDYFTAMLYGLDMHMEDTTATKVEFVNQKFYIERRILYISRYTLNKETYAYYSKMNEQMQSDETLFDPIATQIKGNIKCISDPDKKAIGFFEASSVVNSAYIVVFHDPITSKPVLINTPYILPPEPVGCRINRFGSPHQSNNIPSFWIFN